MRKSPQAASLVIAISTLLAIPLAGCYAPAHTTLEQSLPNHLSVQTGQVPFPIFDPVTYTREFGNPEHRDSFINSDGYGPLRPGAT